jgi:hypothetical protein
LINYKSSLYYRCKLTHDLYYIIIPLNNKAIGELVLTIYGLSEFCRADTVVYGVLVDSDNNKDTGKYGVDFQKEIQWNSKLRSLNTLLVEYSSPEHSRTLDLKSNSTNFFGQDQKYVLIPLEMESITFPGTL